MNGWRSHIKNLKECFIRYPKTSNVVKKTWLCLIFSTHFSMFGYPDETLFLAFDILLETLPCEFLYSGYFTLSTHLINPDSCLTCPQCSTTFPSETRPLHILLTVRHIMSYVTSRENLIKHQHISCLVIIFLYSHDLYI